MAKIKEKEIIEEGIGIPEWCLFVYIRRPTQEEVERTIKYLQENPDILRIPSVVLDAAFSLLVRHDTGERVWADTEIVLISKRQHDVLNRIFDKYSDTAAPVIALIESLIKGKDYDSASD